MHPESPLRRAGLRPGDVVTALDGEPVQSPEEFSFRLATLGIGGEARLTYLRQGRSRDARIALVPPPRP
jgi:S1-C subfamily serine protease